MGGGHDLGGNRKRVEYRAAIGDINPASQDSYTRTSGTNRIASVTTPAGTRSFTHDARGNRTAEDRPGTNDVTVGYDGFARLTSYVRTGDASLAMTYNGMDQRVTLVSGGVTRRFVYDQDGRLLGEYGPNGSQFFAEYIWMLPEVGDAGTFGGDDGTGGWTPLAVAASNGAGATQTFHWLHSSHLGVPNGSYNASGTATTLTGITLLGFPGQTQTLADLYYNQYRDYDPTTGRYLQADPIGLAGDVNPYVYAGANPVGKVDPWGLECLYLANPQEEPARYARHQRQCDAVDRPGELHIFGHCSPNSICEGAATQRDDCMTAAQFYSKQRARYEGRFSSITLWACNTGRIDGGFAQQTANLWRVRVNAPTDSTWWYEDGRVIIAERVATWRQWLDDVWNGREVHRNQNTTLRHDGGPDLGDLGSMNSFFPR